MAVYAAMVDRLDQSVGRIVQCLEDTGQRDHTVVIFLADNGGCEEHLEEGGGNIKRYDLPILNGGRARLGNIPGVAPGPESTFMSYDIGWANASNSPFRQFKKWVHEGGIATPLVVTHPGLRGSAGRIVHDPCHIIDIMPTILEMVGATHPETFRGQRMTPLAGRSVLPALTGRRTGEARSLFWEHAGNRAARVGALKLVAENGAPRGTRRSRGGSDRAERHLRQVSGEGGRDGEPLFRVGSQGRSGEPRGAETQARRPGGVRSAVEGSRP